MTFPCEPLFVSVPFSHDQRGVFSKPYSAESGSPLAFPIRELFWTVSTLGTIRGMHFQTEPADIGKLVWVSQGAIVDVVVDLREGSTYGEAAQYELDGSSGAALFVPTRFAHGFQAVQDSSIVNYAVTGIFSPEHDAGIHWDSFGFTWPLPPTNISPRDQALPSFQDFTEQFTAAQ